MKRLESKYFFVSISIVLILFISTLVYLSLPYINNWRQQYSRKLEVLGDTHPEEALIFYRKAEFFSPNESLYLKIGELYDDSNKLNLAERYFNKIKSENTTLELVNHHLKTGNIDRARALLTRVPPSDDYLYYKALILALDSPQEAIEAISDVDSDKINDIRSYLSSIIDNTNIEFTDTAIALYLYNNNYINLALSKLEPHTDSKYRDLHLLLGNIYFSQGLYTKSATAYESAKTIDPYNYETYRKLISVYEKLGDEKLLLENKIKLKNLTISIQD